MIAAPSASPLKLLPGEPPLVADLDGTLLRTDLLYESMLALIRTHPFSIFLLPFWMLRGAAWLKHQIACRVQLDPTMLPWRTSLIDGLRLERAAGRSMVLATGSDMLLARAAADHLKLFDTVIASDGSVNLCGAAKRDRLVREFGAKGFDYVADGGGLKRADRKVWPSARKAILADAGNPDLKTRTRVHIDILRPSHWLKNVLVFVPLATAHRLHEVPFVLRSLAAFAAFGLCASSGYLFNDLIDLDADRRHPQKRFRPFAAGELPLAYGLIGIPVLLILGWALAALVSPALPAVALLYFGMSASYTLRIKKVAILDVLFLAGLYSVRILAGSVAVDIWPSQWLLAFSTFLFFSLALVKRYGELVIMRKADGLNARARGYELSDSELLAAMGIASGYLAVLVLALYIATDKAQSLYAGRGLLWFLCPLLLYWISYIWLTAHRGGMPGDPIVFATGDRTSRILILLMAVTALVAL